MISLPTAHEVVSFWRDAGPRRWFAKNAAFDAEFKSRFEAAHHAAAAGTLNAWGADAEGALALLVLLDQFPRNAWRGSADMYATDGKALAIARAAVEKGFDQQVDPALRRFFYLPYMHAESLEAQELCVTLNAALDADTQRFARMHRDIIARFGRFPHRNEAMGRDTTPEERDFLAKGGFRG